MSRVLAAACLVGTCLLGAVAMAQAGAPDGQNPTAARVTIDGRAVEINAQRELPRAIFGAHATPVDERFIEDVGIESFRQIHFIPSGQSGAIVDGQVGEIYRRMAVMIDCQGDRYLPAMVLTDPDYERFFRRIGRQYAQAAADAEWHAYAEFWNSPYLNWAGQSRRNYDAKFYDVSQARDEGPVTIRGWDQPLEHLRWRRLWARDPLGRIHWSLPIPPGARAGDTFRASPPSDWHWGQGGEQTFTVVEQWNVHDPSAVSWWAGRQDLDFYLRMFLPWAQAIKETNPRVQVLAGWDFGFSHGDWAVWHELYVPLLEAGAQWIDGLTEHHYGGNTRQVTTWYEVATAHTVARHGRWMRVFNTESAGRAATTFAAGDAGPNGGVSELHRQMASATYMLRDVLELLHYAPDKVGSRAVHQLHADMGAQAAFRLLRDLRGQLLHVVTDDHDLWPVAVRNGDSLVVAVFNDADEPRAIDWSLAAPAGTTLRDGRAYYLEPDATGEGLTVGHTRLGARGSDASVQWTLEPRQAVKLVFPLRGTPHEGVQVRRTQHFAREGVLHQVGGSEPLRLHVELPAERLEQAERAWVRLVLEESVPARASLQVNGRPVEIPARQWTMDLPIDPAILESVTVLEFSAQPGLNYRVCAASILLETPVQ